MFALNIGLFSSEIINELTAGSDRLDLQHLQQIVVTTSQTAHVTFRVHSH